MSKIQYVENVNPEEMPLYWETTAKILINHNQRIENVEKQLSELNRNKELVDRISIDLSKERYEKMEGSGSNRSILQYTKKSTSRKKYSQSYIHFMKPQQNKDYDSLKETLIDMLGNEDIQTQVQLSSGIVQKIKNILKNTPKEKNNYKRQLLMLLHEAVKKNYSKKIFTREQIDVLTAIVKTCKKEVVSNQEYYKYDEALYNCDLDVLPAWE